MKRNIRKFFLLFLALCLFSAAALSEGEALGLMEVVNCSEWVSLRAQPDASSKRVEKVPLGTVVSGCIDAGNGFIYAETKEHCGFIQSEYLRRTDGITGEYGMSPCAYSQEELAASGEEFLREEHGGKNVVAVREKGNAERELVRVCCYEENGSVLWGWTAYVNYGTQYNCIDVFMAGSTDQPAVALYNSFMGLYLLNLSDGTVRWSLPKETLALGGGLVHAVDTDGSMYLTGADNPDVAAVSPQGALLWKNSTGYPSEIYWPYEIEIATGGILVRYEGGSAEVFFGIDGSVRDIRR